MEDHPGVVNTDNSIPSDPEPSGAMASVIIIRQIIKDNLRKKYHKNSIQVILLLKKLVMVLMMIMKLLMRIWYHISILG